METFHKRYQEHFHDFKFNIKKSRFAAHLLENKHSIGPINEVMEILYATSKCRFMVTAEKCYIYSETRNNNQIKVRTQSNPTPYLRPLVPMIPHRSLTDM